MKYHQPSVVHKPSVLCLLSFILIAAATLSGCHSSQTGVEVTSSAASAIDIGDIKWDEYKIPIVSVISGPRTKVFVHHDYCALESVEAGGYITNNVEALSIVTSSENKCDYIKLRFRPPSTTNDCAAASVPR